VVKIFIDPVTRVGFGDILGLFPFEAKDLTICLQSVQSWFASSGVRQSAVYPIETADQPVYTSAGFVESNRHRYFRGIGNSPADVCIEMLDVDVY
jgi:hypothetical protein